MSGTIFIGSYPTGISLTDVASNPATIASTATVTNTNDAGVYAVATVDWSITNAGSILVGGNSVTSVGIALLGSGTVSNVGSASIAGYEDGVLLGGAGTVLNSGSIAATATGTKVGVGVRLNGGILDNNLGGSISANYVAGFLTSPGSVDNAGLMQAADAVHSYGLAMIGVGGLTNEATGTITSGNVGVEITGLGTVTNLGSIASTAVYDFAGPDGYRAGLSLRGGGMVTNAESAHISSQWIGVKVGYSGKMANGTVVNQGNIFASDGTNGAAVWFHGTGLIDNEATGTIEGGPFGVVAYYDTTIVNRGVIIGTEFAISEANTKYDNLIQVAPGATFVGTVEGGATAASAATGTLELLVGDVFGTINGFGTQFVGFGGVLLDAGAAWTLAGTVAASQSLTFAGPGQLTLTNPTAMAGKLFGFETGDSLVLSGVTGVTSAVVNAADQIVVSTASGPAVTLQLDPTRHDPVGTTFGFTQSGDATTIVACFAEGTRIATEHGDLPVEALAAGMRVRSPFGGGIPVVWLGHRRTDCRRHPRPQDVRPVRIEAGAFGTDASGAATPARTLRLSPDHAVFFAGVLIPVRYLVNGRSVAQVEVEEITYWHVELPRHDVLLAEGLPCESFLDTGNRAAFANGGPAAMLHPDFALQVWREHACAELVRDGARLEAARARLLEFAEKLGHERTDDACLTLFADARHVALSRDRTRFRAARVGGRVRLCSRTWVPAHTRAGEQDHRVLGVAIADLRFAGTRVPLDDPRLGVGWHAPEDGWRWTGGEAVLDLEGRGTLEFRLALPGSYWRDARAASRLAG